MMRFVYVAEDLLNKLIEVLNSKFVKCIDFAFENNIYNKVATVIILTAIAAGFYVLNHHTPYLVDDFFYDFKGWGNNRITSLGDVTDSVKTFYLGWGGRLGCAFFPFLFMLIDKDVFDIANTIAYIFLILGINFLSIGWARVSVGSILLINGIIFLLSPAFGQFFIWLTGAGAYLWPMVIAVYFMIPFRMQMEADDELGASTLLSLGFGVLGIFAGCGHELIGCATFSSIAIASIAHYKRFHHFPIWMKAGLGGCLLGLIIFFAAPGNYVRLASAESDYSVIKHVFQITRWLWQPEVLMIPAGMAAVMALLPAEKRNKNICIMLIVAVLASMYAMAVAPDAPVRVKVVPVIFLSTLIGYIYSCLDFKDNSLRKGFAIFFLMIVFQLENSFGYAYEAVANFEEVEKRNEMHVLEEREAGRLDVVIQENVPGNMYCASWKLPNVGPDKNDWVNKGYAKYYEINSVEAKSFTVNR